jgi:hypothetical protein
MRTEKPSFVHGCRLHSGTFVKSSKEESASERIGATANFSGRERWTTGEQPACVSTVAPVELPSGPSSLAMPEPVADLDSRCQVAHEA